MRSKTRPKLTDLVSAIAKFTADMDAIASVVKSDDDYSGVVRITYSDDGPIIPTHVETDHGQ